MKRITVLLILLVLLFLAGNAGAMSSPHYKLDWFTPLTGGGGGPASSAHYAVNLTIGQTVIGASSSTGYRAGLGYWYGIAPEFRVYLPVVVK
jgi:hypothetical protein